MPVIASAVFRERKLTGIFPVNEYYAKKKIRGCLNEFSNPFYNCSAFKQIFLP